MTSSHNSAPLVRRRINDPKRPWLDWRADEPSPFPEPAKTKKVVSSAYWLFFMLNGLGAHRIYLDKGWAAARWAFFMLALQLPAVLLSSDLEGESFSARPVAHVFLWLLSFSFVFILYREFKTIRPNVEAYNKEHNL